jgi:hypothetical protein
MILRFLCGYLSLEKLNSRFDFMKMLIILNIHDVKIRI